MAKRILKAFTKKNELTPDPNDLTAVLSSMGSLNKDDIIDEIIADGIEIKRDTLVSVVSRYHTKVADKVLSGYNVNTGLVYMRPVIKGAIYGKTWNPETNTVYVSITQGAELRAAIAETEVQLLGEMANPMELHGITDQLTGATDGSLTKGRTAELKGSYIKLVGENPTVGITFRNTATKAETKLAATDIVYNDPSRIQIFVPTDLPAGEYELTVTTQYTGGNTLLKQPRSLTLSLPIIIG